MAHATWMYKNVDGTLTPRLFEEDEEIPEGWHDNPTSAMEPEPEPEPEHHEHKGKKHV